MSTPVYITRPVAWIVAPAGEPIFSERATRVEIDDEAAGEYVTVTQHCGDKIKLDSEDWPHIAATIREAFEEIERNETRKDGELDAANT